MANRKTLISGFKLAAVAAVGLLASANLAALGLGTLDIRSNLNQPLDGVIEMRVSAGDDISSITASIASKEDFLGLAIDYPSYLSDLTISIEGFGSDSVLRVVSNDVVIKEPFIHFLVRVDWAGGSFLREYTALIDPPVYAAETPQSIAKPKAVGTDQSYQAFNDDAQDQFEAEVAYDSAAQDVAATRSQEDFSTNAQYGPVTSGESLSMIAAELQSQFPDLSIYQIMLVMFEENRDAFISDNINGLLKGSVLNIGDLDAIRVVKVAQAKQFFFDQVNEWELSLIASNSASSDSGLRVAKDQYDYSFDSSDDFSRTSITDTTVDNFQVGSSGDIVQGVSASQGDSSDGEVFALQQEITELQSSLSSSTLENRELSERVSILEEQIADMNRLVRMNVEDAELASLEATLADQNDAESLVEDSELVVGDAVVEKVSSIDDLVGEYLSGENEAALALGDETAVDTKPTPVVSGPKLGLFEKITTALLDDGLWKILAGTGVVLLSGLIILLFRRRRADEEFEISMLSIETHSQSIDDAILARKAAEKSTDRETSFLTVYSDSDAVVHASEVDPIAEADVYIAYGRDEQAEEVLLDGVASKPWRVDIKQKLLGLYHKNNNVEGFERIAEELYSQKKQLTSQIWETVSLMGKDIAPDNPLFDVSSAELLADALPGADLASDTQSPKVADGSGAAANADGSYEIEPREIAPGISLAQESSSINLVNFNDGRSEISELDDIDISELDLGSGSFSDADGFLGAERSTRVEEDSGIDIGGDFGDDSAFLNGDETSLTKSFEGSSTVEFEPATSAVDNKSKNDSDAESDQRIPPDLSDLDIDHDYDEAQTQYELAKVFIDLGDEDGARKILDELVANDEISQNVMSSARKLLKSLQR